MFSSRVTWDLAPNRLSKLLEAERARGVKLLDLAESNPTCAGFDYDTAAILAALSAPEAMRYDPSARGLLSARQAVADYYASHARQRALQNCHCEPAKRAKQSQQQAKRDCFGGRTPPRNDVHPDSIFLTASTSEGYGFLFKLLADSGGEILVPQPSYPLFDFLIALESAKAVHYRLKYDDRAGWAIDFKSLRAEINDKTAAIVVVSPNNPTGNCLDARELDELNALCREYDLALIIDEVFLDYARGETAVGNSDALTFVLSGLSKVAGLPQAKLGWIQVSGPDSLRTAAQNRLELIADTYLSVGAPVQHAAGALLAGREGIQKQIIARCDENSRFLEAQCANTFAAQPVIASARRARSNLAACRKRLLRRSAPRNDVSLEMHPSSACRVLLRDGGWYAVIEMLGANSDEEIAYQLLQYENVIVHPGYFYDFDSEHILVVSLLTPVATFQEGIARMMRRLPGMI